MTQILVVGIIAGVLYIIQHHIYQKYWDKNLSGNIYFKEKELVENEKGTLCEIIVNDKKLPLPMVKVKFMTSKYLRFDNSRGTQNTDNYYRNDVFCIGGGERITRSLSFTAEKRGVFFIKEAEIVGNDLFFSNQQVDILDLGIKLFVLPKPYVSKEFNLSLQWLNGEILSRRHLLEDPFEFRGIREYQPYDGMKSINWKASAKTGDFRVNLHDYTSIKYIRIFINLDDTGVWKKPKCIESSLNIAAGLIRNFAALGIEYSLYSNGIDIFTGEPVAVSKNSGSYHEKECFRALAKVDLSKPMPSFSEALGDTIRDNRSGLCDCIISANAYGDFLELLDSYENGADYVWFCPVEDDEKPVLKPSVAARYRRIPIWK